MTRPPLRLGRRGWLALASAAVHVAALSAQSVSVSTAGDRLQVRVSRFRFIEGEVLDRLKDGRSVAVDLGLSVLARPGAAPVWDGRERFSLSFDIWEERFAVTRVGTPARSVSHLTAGDAESWCLENLTVPRSAVGALGRGEPFWIRFTYEARDVTPRNAGDEDGVFTLRTLIDMLGRRSAAAPLRRTVDAGPFRVPG